MEGRAWLDAYANEDEGNGKELRPHAVLPYPRMPLQDPVLFFFLISKET